MGIMNRTLSKTAASTRAPRINGQPEPYAAQRAKVCRNFGGQICLASANPGRFLHTMTDHELHTTVIHSQSESNAYSVRLDAFIAVRDNGAVVKIARPADSELADDPVKILGNRVHLALIGHLRRHPHQTSSAIATALDVPKPTVVKAIERLMGLDMLLADPPRERATRGQWIRYRVNDPLVTEMYLQLGQAIEEM